MRYSFETYYLKHNLPIQDAILTVAKTAGLWCCYYKACIFWPKDGIKNDKQEGELPKDNRLKEVFIENLVRWVFEADSSHSGGFQLFLGSTKSNQKFVYPDTPSCWVLDLDQKQFAILQDNLRENNLPKDLFYPANKVICVPSKRGIWKLLGFQKCFSPKEWEEYQQRVG